MAVSPFRALLTAHGQTTWNQSARELGRQGQWALVLTVLAAVFFGAGLLLVGSGALGWLLGTRLDQAPVPLLLGGLLTLIGFGGGLLGGVLGGARQLSWEAYRGFPLRLATLYGAELLAGAGDLLPIALGSATAGILLGVGLAVPILLPLVPILWLETLLTLLAVQLLVEGLATVLVKRLRAMLLVLGILAWLGSTLLGGRVSARSESSPGPRMSAHQIAQLQSAGQTLATAARLLPGTAAVRSLSLARQGRWGAALGQHLYPIGVVALLMLLGARLMQRESDAERPVEKGMVASRLWSFHQPAEGIGRLHFQTIMRSHLGKVSFLMPLMTIVLLMGCLFLAQASVGQWTSAWAPRPMAMDTLKHNNMPFTIGLLSIATSGLWSSVFGGAYALTAWLIPLWLLPVMALLFGLTLTGHLALLPLAAAYLDRRREVLVERLG